MQAANGNSAAIGGKTFSSTGLADASASGNMNGGGSAVSVTKGGSALSGPAIGGDGGNGGNSAAVAVIH
jgi:hypothetical protein